MLKNEDNKKLLLAVQIIPISKVFVGKMYQI